MALPPDFVARIRGELGEAEAAALCGALDSPAPRAVRYNPCKCTAPPAGQRAVPWSDWGRFPQEPEGGFTLDPAFHAGQYYVQEAASQFVGRLVADLDLHGARLLDLCAAPGGKTTLYAGAVGAEGLVVANEISRQRAAVLAENARKWGSGNIAVTIGDAAQFVRFENWFDVVAVDAPCSGEGMFRRLPESRDEWSPAGVERCARRQTEILHNAWQALKPGGRLIYSTCTFNRTENEAVLEAFSAWAGEELCEAPAVACDTAWGVTTGRTGAFQTFRFYPHRTEGEGFFAAVAEKSPDAGREGRLPKAGRRTFEPVERRAAAELERWLAGDIPMRFGRIGESCYAIPEAQYAAVEALAAALPVIASGVAMGQLYKGALKPDPALALYARLNRTAVAAADLSRDEALRYLRKQECDARPFAEGMNLVTCNGLALGFAKRIGGRVNNLYPNSSRILKQP